MPSETFTHLERHKPDALQSISNDEQVLYGTQRSDIDANVEESHSNEALV